MAKKVSKMGMPRITIGIKRDIKAALLAVPRIAIPARTKPRKFEPPSPIKVLAG
jgi:hypothetical protein